MLKGISHDMVTKNSSKLDNQWNAVKMAISKWGKKQGTAAAWPRIGCISFKEACSNAERAAGRYRLCATCDNNLSCVLYKYLPHLSSPTPAHPPKKLKAQLSTLKKNTKSSLPNSYGFYCVVVGWTWCWKFRAIIPKGTMLQHHQRNTSPTVKHGGDSFIVWGWTGVLVYSSKYLFVFCLKISGLLESWISKWND